MTGLRERKKRQTRQAIAEAAMRLFAERGFEAVTVNEIAEAAGVAKVTLFTYFPTKESLVLDAVADDDVVKAVAQRRPGQSPLDALREHYRTFTADPGDVEPEALVTMMRVIFESPTLVAGVNQIQYGERVALTHALMGTGERQADDPTGECQADDPAADLTARLMAAQISAATLTLKETFFNHLASGTPLSEAGRGLMEDLELAFDLIEHGFGDRFTR
ncbi:TetR/AcrR family transcriptional regulator [Streptosporangium sp. 'caverna']|uniref:TetR/AcrR family transcriptional regulator n=1 Tax=Streptosporangium sp. 'caverna' TaxID=2202249 RepID=UPI000D7E14D8|nr:TetR family transcriptional regulator [Streptosporangium sp. 'caverna']AWS44958.1 TetR family transcriptional regulator [Streptosporangium sp. 'caverna']